MNRGKRSVALDVSDPAARAGVERLVARRGRFLQNFAPGWADRVGLDEPTCARCGPTSSTWRSPATGPTARTRKKNAYDLVVQGEAGLLSRHRNPGEPARVGVSACDLGAGSYAAVGGAGALVRRGRPGRGRVSRSRSSTRWSTGSATSRTSGGTAARLPGRTGMRHPLFCPYGPFPAARRTALRPRRPLPGALARVLPDVLGRPDLLAEERYATNEARVAAAAELEPLLEEASAPEPPPSGPTAEAAGIPCGAVNDIPDVLAHPQLAHNGLVTEIDSPVGRIPTIGSPFSSTESARASGAVPGLGEHTEEVLKEIGLEAPASPPHEAALVGAEPRR